MDIRERVDQFLAAPKSIIGPPKWEIGSRPETRILKRALLEDGEAVDAFLHSQAYPRTALKEYRHLIVFAGKCVTRLDYAPTIDGPHFNGFSCPAGYPAEAVNPMHYHDWAGNRHFASGKTIPKLLCAREIQSRINDIDQAFWWFCQQNHIDATSADEPGWPPLDKLL